MQLLNSQQSCHLLQAGHLWQQLDEQNGAPTVLYMLLQCGHEYMHKEHCMLSHSINPSAQYSCTFIVGIFHICQYACNPNQTVLCGQVRFERGVIETPQLLTDREFPSFVNFLGQSIDLTSLKASLQITVPRILCSKACCCQEATFAWQCATKWAGAKNPRSVMLH